MQRIFLLRVRRRQRNSLPLPCSRCGPPLPPADRILSRSLSAQGTQPESSGQAPRLRPHDLPRPGPGFQSRLSYSLHLQPRSSTPAPPPAPIPARLSPDFRPQPPPRSGQGSSSGHTTHSSLRQPCAFPIHPILITDVYPLHPIFFHSNRLSPNPSDSLQIHSAFPSPSGLSHAIRPPLSPRLFPLYPGHPLRPGPCSSPNLGPAMQRPSRTSPSVRFQMPIQFPSHALPRSAPPFLSLSPLLPVRLSRPYR